MLLIRLFSCVFLLLVTACSNPFLGAPISIDKSQIHVKAAIRAPVACKRISSSSCGDDISLEKAKKSYRELGGYTPELTTLTDDHTCGDASTTGQYHYWAPMERFSDGNNALKALRNHAQNGKPFNGWVIVESDNSTKLEQHLALCSVSQVNDKFGPPRDCVAVAIITSNETWLRGGNRNLIGCKSARFRNTGGIEIEFDLKTKIDPLKISTELMSVLTDHLDLSVEEKISKSKTGKIGSIYIKATGSLRESKILPLGWSEALDFDLVISPTENGISISGIVHALVCRQNLGNLVNYRGLDDSQRSAYSEAFEFRVDSAIRSSCKKYEKRDAKTIICD